MRIVDGLAIAQDIRREVAAEITGRHPCLAVILVGNNPASEIYVKKKHAACKEVGIESMELRYGDDLSEEDLLSVVDMLNDSADVHGILVQLPLPSHINKFKVFNRIDYRKDVDVFTPHNTGLLIQDRPLFVPCTPQAIQEILVRSGVVIQGRRVVIINRSLVVGQPLASMLIQNRDFANATVTVCHEFTDNIKDISRNADIVVTAVGNRDNFFLTADFVKPGAAVIDVAIIRDGKKICGDVDFDAVSRVAGVVTPVPGGVGPVVVACLLRNTLQAYKLQT